MQTLQDLLPEIQRLDQREAIGWTNGFRTVVSTYVDLHGTIGTVINYFAENGIGKGDRVLIWAENRMEWAAVFWACVASGVVAVPVDLRFSEELVRRIQSESNSKLTIDGAELDRIAKLPRASTFSWTPVDREDIVEIVYTSGTTGEPKGVTHRHRSISTSNGRGHFSRFELSICCPSVICSARRSESIFLFYWGARLYSRPRYRPEKSSGSCEIIGSV